MNLQIEIKVKFSKDTAKFSIGLKTIYAVGIFLLVNEHCYV
jgi:hypothetical protein